MAALFFTACDKDIDFPGSNVGGDGNSIILDLSSGSLPVSRALNATGVEIKVDHIDVLIFGEDGSKKHHERVNGSETGSGTIALTAKRSDFAADTKYWVHLIANSKAEESVFAAEDFDRNTLLGMTQEDDEIHMTGCPSAEGVPQAFLMDGVAYLKGDAEPEPTAAGPVVLNNGNKSDDTKLQVTLRRAAAKLVIRINKGDFVEFNNESGTRAGYYLRNMPYTTSVVAGVGAEAALRTPTLTDNAYFRWTQDVEDGPYTLITVTAYAYAHTWENESALEKETRLIVNIPMYAILHNADDNYIDESGNPSDTPVRVPHVNSYYQIPVCRGKALERNTCYEVSLTLNVPGGTEPSNPVVLEPIEYEVRKWDEKTIDIGGESDRPAYLTLNENEMEMHNMEEDRTTLQFSSSSEVTAEITKVYYIDKFGKEQELEKKYPDNPDNNEWGVKTTSSGWPWGNETTTWSNDCEIRITPDEGINGKIDVFGDVPENNAVRYIEFTVTNETGQSRSVTVAQYPLEYITNVEGWYSYRDDFVTTASDGTSGVTTWELLAGKSINKGTAYSTAQVSYNNNNAWRCGCSWDSRSQTWSYGKTETGFFASKVARNFNEATGLSTISYARWTESRSNRSPYTYTYNTNSSNNVSNMNNHRMYHVTITASSGEYTLGRPRLDDEGYTDGGADNAKLVSPSFMLASQLGSVYAIEDKEGAAQHCERYVEVSRDGTVYDDWRLPTEAELKIIMKFQNTSDAMSEVLTYSTYWGASGEVTNSNGNGSTGAIRCIRDAYDDKKTGNQ